MSQPPYSDPYQQNDPYQQPTPYPPPNPYGAPIQYGQPAAPAKTNGFAIASLIFGIIPAVLLSVIFGIIALVQIKNRGERGKGMAIAGLVLSAIWTVVICAGTIIAIVLAADEAGTTPETRASTETRVRIESLQVGDCVNGLKEGTGVLRLPVIHCSAPHQGEVVGKYEVSGSVYPGEDEITAQAEERCFELLDEYSPSTKDDESIDLFYYYPTSGSWSQGDRGVLCIAEHTDGAKTGSIKG